jgi:hypothetical protein
MKRVVPVLCLSAAVAFTGAPARAENQTIAPNTFVRVQAPSLDQRPIRGLVVSMDDEMLTLKSEVNAWDRGVPTPLRKIPMAAVRSLEIRGKSHGSVGARVIGAIAGAILVPIVVGKACATKYSSDDGGRCAAYALVAVLPGAGIGMATGNAASSQTEWKAVSLDGKRVGISVGPAPGRGWKAGISVGF